MPAHGSNRQKRNHAHSITRLNRLKLTRQFLATLRMVLNLLELEVGACAPITSAAQLSASSGRVSGGSEKTNQRATHLRNPIPLPAVVKVQAGAFISGGRSVSSGRTPLRFRTAGAPSMPFLIFQCDSVNFENFCLERRSISGQPQKQFAFRPSLNSPGAASR